MTETAIIIGNGPTRKGLDLKTLPNRHQVKTWGCNAIIREFLPDYVVAIDPLPLHEIMSTLGENDWYRFTPTPWDEQFEPAEANPNRPRNNAGMVAMKFAIGSGFDRLVMVGMDFAIQNEDINEGNIFKGSHGYGPETRCSYHDTANRWKFMEWFAAQHPSVEFIFLFKGKDYTFRQTQVPNIRIVTIEDWEEVHGYCK